MSNYTDPKDGAYRVDQIAYEIWTWKAQRNAKETSRQMKELDLGDFTPQEIAKWARDYNWASLADQDIKSLAPSIHNETLGGLIIAGLKGQRILDGLLEAWSERKIPPPKEVLTMLDITFKYAGMSPMGIKDPTEKMRARTGVASSIVDRYLSADERRAVEEEGFIPQVTSGGTEE